jgi:Ca2+-transporting ATPase
MPQSAHQDDATTADSGLTSLEVARRLELDGPNQIPRARDPTLATRFVRHLVEPLSAVLLVAGLVTMIVLQRRIEGAAILAIVVLNAIVGAAQERSSAAAIRALERIVAPVALVRRDGRDQVVAASQLVRGDLVSVRSGDIVPADLRLLSAASLSVDEATITGESWPADKSPPLAPLSAPDQDSSGELFSGTSVVRGTAPESSRQPAQERWWA